MSNANPFESAARARKVAALARVIRRAFGPANAFQLGALAALLLGTTQEARDAFARQVGQRSPSAETWRQVVEAVRS